MTRVAIGEAQSYLFFYSSLVNKLFLFAASGRETFWKEELSRGASVRVVNGEKHQPWRAKKSIRLFQLKKIICNCYPALPYRSVKHLML